MRGLKRPFIGVLVASSWLLGGCGEVEPALRDTELEASLPFTQPLAATQSTSFQDGVAPTTDYAGTRDAMIEEEDSDANHGSDTKLSASGDTPAGSGNENFALLAWDVSAIPANAVVRSASLTVTVSDKADQDYQLYALTRGWTESQVTWEQADNNQDWASNGADGTGDRDSTVLGTLRAPATGTYTVALNAQGVAAVQRWVSTPASNQGLILANKDNDNRLELRSSEYSTKASRPRLTVTWEASGTPGGEVPASGTFKGTCDGSGGAWVDGTHFLNVNDESQSVRIYTRSQSATAVKTQDVSAAIGLSSSDEADLEDVARVGNRLYVTGSHARNKDGELESSRYKFFALDVAGTVPSVTLQVAGTSSTLLRDLLDAANWDAPDSAVITLLNARSRLAEPTVASLAPKLNGTNVEGLAALPSGELAIGFRNPRVGSSALVVTLTNPDAVLTGATARFGRAIPLNLGGQGLRGMAWSEAHQAMLLLSGPHDESSGPFALWKWSGDASSAPVKVVDLTAPENSAPEAVIPYPGSLDVQVLFDMGSRLMGGTECKDVASSSQSFSDVFVHVD
ncbi:DUF3616 domain-containing protein [Myxococcus llanfairpwllgwyngyllgogerychwyrndrobwllllantysiliogogogochensis]|uniref:DUF3616 domain-containing protein n=1 Tax=Myxococcus llanfairpwllgwyngyllgogerychwyrndrobwllllantysiliogogogochensis TaxID=2590453 RepID=A0A540WXS3_9BACT|nr:DUF3616 domain-containing protein [Myxococcus llanfairpwllgwyngyllgogerychwyrndrobwllllantysiliogogogochensis]TQF13801.1 DUF3616 domain-containing protein [Myxococcus llanfairpwllgwyngyllgogerychwyrndrobwllllantysiliogogogochensis]